MNWWYSHNETTKAWHINHGYCTCCCDQISIVSFRKYTGYMGSGWCVRICRDLIRLHVHVIQIEFHAWGYFAVHWYNHVQKHVSILWCWTVHWNLNYSFCVLYSICYNVGFDLVFGLETRQLYSFFTLNSDEIRERLIHMFSKYLKPWEVFHRLPFYQIESHNIRLPHDYTSSW